MPFIDDPFRIKRFKLLDGQDITLYCRLMRLRSGPAGTFSLYEDNHGLEWMEIFMNDQPCLIPLDDESFEDLVAEELLTLGLNKYRG